MKVEAMALDTSVCISWTGFILSPWTSAPAAAKGTKVPLNVNYCKLKRNHDEYSNAWRLLFGGDKS